MSAGACRGGNNPDRGRDLWYDRNCQDRCTKNPLCTGFTLPRDNASWCELYESVGATGDGKCDSCFACGENCNKNCSFVGDCCWKNTCYDCYMKGKRYIVGY